MPDKKQETIQATDIELTNPNGVQSVYANDFGLGLTLTDARFLFVEVGAEAGTPSKILKANVVMPLQMAEAVAKTVLDALHRHRDTVAQALKDAKSAEKS